MSDNNTRSRYFIEQLPLLKPIYDMGMQLYMQQLIVNGMIQDPFGRENRPHQVACCIDEGLDGVLRFAPLKIEKDWIAAVRKMAELLIASGAHGISSHANCGAVKLYCLENGIIQESMAPELSKAIVEAMSRQYALNVVEKAHQIAPDMDFRYFGHIESHEMRRPEGLHHAMAICISASEFNCDSPHLPAMFYIDTKFLDVQTAIDTLHIAIGIAFGDGGMNDFITEDHPLVIIPVGGDSISTRELTAIVLNEVNNSVFKGLIRVSPLDPTELPIKSGILNTHI